MRDADTPAVTLGQEMALYLMRRACSRMRARRDARRERMLPGAKQPSI
jgi:hypothetical protein